MGRPHLKFFWEGPSPVPPNSPLMVYALPCTADRRRHWASPLHSSQSLTLNPFSEVLLI